MHKQYIIFAAAWLVAGASLSARAGLVVNLRFDDGMTSTKVSAAHHDAHIPIQVWVAVTNVGGANGAGTHEGLQYLFYSLQSHLLINQANGFVGGELENSVLQAPFAASGSQLGEPDDFNGDGFGDLGSAPSLDSNSSYIKPRAAGATFDDDPSVTGHAIAGGFEFLVGTVDFHVHEVPNAPVIGAGTRIDVIPAAFTNVATANWWQDSTKSGPPFDGVNALSFSAGTSITVFAVSGWQNQANPLDVNDDTDVVAFDVLLIINELNRSGPHELGPPTVLAPPPFYDVDGDGSITALDALIVINHLNTPGAPAPGGPQPLAISAPEPATWLLGLVGFLALGIVRLVRRPR